MLLNKINLDIDYDYFLNADYTQHSGSCLAHQSTEQKDLHDESSIFLNSEPTPPSNKSKLSCADLLSRLICPTNPSE